MRVVIMLRPTNRRGTKGEYTAFRKLLTSSGFALVQPEVFVRAVATRRAAKLQLERLKEHVPTTGTICAITLTERQFAAIEYLVGEPSYQEQLVGSRTNVSL